MNLKEEWLQELESSKLKYFVLKIEDLFNALSDEEIELLDSLLVKNEQYLIKLGKKVNNKYWVVNRDEPYADQIKKIIEDNEGIKL